MKIFAFAALLFCLNLTVGLMAVVGPEVGLTSAGNNTLINHIGEEDITEVLNTSGSETGFIESVWDSTSMATKGVNLVMRFLYQTTVGLPAMFLSAPFNLPSVLVYMFIVPLQVFVYAIGIADFLRGTTT